MERKEKKLKAWGKLGVWLVFLSLCVVWPGKGGDPAAASRAAVCHDLENMALRAQQHFHLPAGKGGGNGSFTASGSGVSISNINQLTPRPTNANGTYTLGSISATSVILTGHGFARGNDGSVVQVVAVVFPDSVAFLFNN